MRGERLLGKYNSPYYNPERYYDPTAGAALAAVIRKEKKAYRKVLMDAGPRERKSGVEFSKIFAEFYRQSFGLTEKGKVRRLSKYENVYGYIRIYQYCMDHANDEDFTVDKAVEALKLGTDKKVEQVFSGRGVMGNVIRCYKDWMQTGSFSYRAKGITAVYGGGKHKE